MSGVLIFLGAAVCFVGAIMLWIDAFGESVLWGLGCIIIPGVILIFVLLHWDETKKGVAVVLTGVGLIFLGTHISS